MPIPVDPHGSPCRCPLRGDARTLDGVTCELTTDRQQRLSGWCAEAEVGRLRAQVRSAEDRAAHLERALVTNRRIGIAVGILMCQLHLTEDQAVEELKARSQHRNVKVRELAEAVIYTGIL